MENCYLSVYRIQMIVDLFYQNLSFRSFKTEINKNRVYLINFKVQESLKRQIPAVELPMLLNHH